jgi:hypothetical protein
LTPARLHNLRHYRRQRALRNAQLVRELRRGWLGRLALWFYYRRLRRVLDARAQAFAEAQAS